MEPFGISTKNGIDPAIPRRSQRSRDGADPLAKGERTLRFVVRDPVRWSVCAGIRQIDADKNADRPPLQPIIHPGSASRVGCAPEWPTPQRRGVGRDPVRSLGRRGPCRSEEENEMAVKRRKKKTTTKARKKVRKVKGRKKVAKRAKKKTAKRKVTKRSTKKAAKPRKKVARKAKKKTAKRKKRKANPAFMKPLTPSAALAEIVGAKPLPRPQVVKKLWAYIKKNDLQDNKDRRMINADALLKPIFRGQKQVNMFKMTALVSKHLK